MANELISANAETEIVEKESLLSTTVGDYQKNLSDFLSFLKLPSEKILVDYKERKKVIINIPDIVGNIDECIRENSYYISKFIAASGAGLFDAALNYIWDETITSLRKKIGLFDLEYFKSTLPEDKKKKVNTIDDLKHIDDNDVVSGCSDIGILSEIGYKHINYIRDMRNWVSAAHPNQVELTGLNICAWLEICIREVIGKEPSKPAIQTQQLLTNLRNNVYTKNDVGAIKQALLTTPTEFIISLFTTLFGMFCDPKGKVEVKNNIRLIAKDIWTLLPEQNRKETGIKYAQWSVNGDLPRKTAAREFLEAVEGLSYLTEDVVSVELTDALRLLHNTHNSFYNFYNEPPFARLIKKYIPDNGAVPDAVRRNYVRTLLLCKMGNCFGVSVLAEPVYDELISKFTDKEITETLFLFRDLFVIAELSYEKCQINMRSILELLKTHTSNSRLLQLIDYILSKNNKQFESIAQTADYKRLFSLI